MTASAYEGANGEVKTCVVDDYQSYFRRMLSIILREFGIIDAVNAILATHMQFSHVVHASSSQEVGYCMTYNTYYTLLNSTILMLSPIEKK